MSYDHWKTTNPEDEFLGPDPGDNDEPTTMKSFIDIGGRLVSITTEFVYPSIPYRGNDWCARYSTDDNEQSDYGWGASAEDAIQDLTDNHDYEDTLPSFAEMYGMDLFFARLHWQGIERAGCI